MPEPRPVRMQPAHRASRGGLRLHRRPGGSRRARRETSHAPRLEARERHREVRVLSQPKTTTQTAGGRSAPTGELIVSDHDGGGAQRHKKGPAATRRDAALHCVCDLRERPFPALLQAPRHHARPPSRNPPRRASLTANRTPRPRTQPPRSSSAPAQMLHALVAVLHIYDPSPSISARWRCVF